MLEHPNQIILINARHRSEKDTCDRYKMGCAEFLRLEVFIKKGCDAKQDAGADRAQQREERQGRGEEEERVHPRVDPVEEEHPARRAARPTFRCQPALAGAAVGARRGLDRGPRRRRRIILVQTSAPARRPRLTSSARAPENPVA